MLDRFHHTPRDGVIERDTWTLRKVAADLRLIDTLLVGTSGPNLGVRVITHRAPNAGIHFLPEYIRDGHAVVGTRHPLGACWNCEPTNNLPVTTGTPRTTAPRINTGARP